MEYVTSQGPLTYISWMQQLSRTDSFQDLLVKQTVRVIATTLFPDSYITRSGFLEI